MKLATKTPRHKVTQKVLLKINPWCLRALVAIIFIVSGRGRGIMSNCYENNLATEDTEGVAPPTYYCSRNTQMPEEKSWNKTKVWQQSNTEDTEKKQNKF